MRYEINIEEMKRRYQIKDNKIGLTHKPGKSISIFPYTIGRIPKESKPKFKNSVASFSRKIVKKTMDNMFDGELYMNNILSNVEENEDPTVFKSILNEMFFNKDGSLNIFHPKVLAYIYANGYDNKLGEFIYDVLINGDEETYSKVEKIYNTKPNNTLIKLLFNSLEELKDKKSDKLTYHNCVDEIRNRFKEDFLFIVKDHKTYIENIESLLKFYYFMYVAQTALKFRRFFDEDENEIDKIYFNLDWENTSRSRVSYAEGWRKVESAVHSIFSHANCLEILNHNNMDKELIYDDIKKILDNMNEEEAEAFIDNMDEVLAVYTNNLEDMEWENLSLGDKYNHNRLYKKVYELFSTIDYQFSVSKRKDLHKRYRLWFEEFCKENFLKSRGRLGFTLNLTEDYLLFMTRIIIKEDEKMKLKDFFKEFERRGVFLDRDSRKNITNLFDKLNILEKKSDSGDAQYVKRVL
ncbi:DNA phosphorothioation-dependent restriction protein DptG [Anaeromicrobium sediminis]|uniref:DNA phosphorothioation-dependent restriction protein DptG n=1 Tax=Anaeromicrobium sediminis TaxID=1478221 RepID=A0A267MLR3_9FIRM|nr:DNA phosphorothioation-dependent restriction protein DptG [Anaeromicrobium sediminis]PAB60529.1 DNA phosphorothioation-dependent restriction protein DptG [Anaeromicrobium sediminis]